MDDNNISNDLFFDTAPVCYSCLKKNKSTECILQRVGFSVCSKGYTVYKDESFKTLFFWGLKVTDHFNIKKCQRNFRDREVKVIKKNKFLKIIGELKFIEKERLIFKRFIHDLGQYTGGMINLLPSRSELNNDNFKISNSEFRSITAFANAIAFFRRFNSNLLFSDEAYLSKKVIFSPFQLFDKFRLCFHTEDISINIRCKDSERFEHKVECIEGFELIVLNLISNAVKYLPKKRFRDVNVTFSQIDDFISIKISSYGPPVYKNEIKKMGSLYFRATEAKNYGTSGDGIGLHMISDYIEKAGLDIEYVSDENKSFEESNRKYWLFQAIIKIPASYIKKSSKVID